MPTFSFSSPQKNIKQLTPKQAMILMPIISIIGLAVTIFIGVPMAQNAMESSSWPTAEGIITVSQVSPSTDSEGDVTYSARVGYTYSLRGSVRGAPYVGSTVSFGNYGSSDPSHAQNIVSRYPIGSLVMVYYDPDDPKTSVLEPGTSLSSFAVAGFGGLFTLIGLAGFVISARKVMGAKGAPPQSSIPVPPTSTI